MRASAWRGSKHSSRIPGRIAWRCVASTWGGSAGPWCRLRRASPPGSAWRWRSSGPGSRPVARWSDAARCRLGGWCTEANLNPGRRQPRARAAHAAPAELRDLPGVRDTVITANRGDLLDRRAELAAIRACAPAARARARRAGERAGARPDRRAGTLPALRGAGGAGRDRWPVTVRRAASPAARRHAADQCPRRRDQPGDARVRPAAARVRSGADHRRPRGGPVRDARRTAGDPRRRRASARAGRSRHRRRRGPHRPRRRHGRPGDRGDRRDAGRPARERVLPPTAVRRTSRRLDCRRRRRTASSVGSIPRASRARWMRARPRRCGSAAVWRHRAASRRHRGSVPSPGLRSGSVRNASGRCSACRCTRARCVAG